MNNTFILSNSQVQQKSLDETFEAMQWKKFCLLTDQLLQKIDAVVKNEQFGVEGLSKVNLTTQELF